MDKMLKLNPNSSYLYIWKFKVAQDKESEFQRIYGPKGEWIRLFRQAEGYRQTLLLKDLDEPGVYTTVDMWESEAAYRVFEKKFAAEFETLDKHCENLTERETQVGRFEIWR
jgi:heme-degrading monooxygenase HmoA